MKLYPELVTRIDWFRPRTFVHGWHSWDGTPWRHPWLEAANLAAMRDYSRKLRARAADFVAGKGSPLDHARAGAQRVLRQRSGGERFAFVGNIANNSVLRSRGLAEIDVGVDIYGHPHDTYVMSYPEWESFDGSFDATPPTIAHFRDLNPEVTCDQPFYVAQPRPFGVLDAEPWMRARDVRDFISHFGFIDTIAALRTYDAVFAVQAPQFAYLANRPYFVTQFGGDIWFEASRNDSLGQLLRLSFAGADAFFVSNPWSYAHARRYGMTNLVQLPLMLSDRDYSPGPADFRAEWERTSGGKFFVLVSARLDDTYKGSKTALDGFTEFAKAHPEARLVILAWGKDREARLATLRARGLEDRCIILPLAGKRRLVRYLRSVDCLLDQFTLGYYGGTALEAMGCAVPVIMRIEAEQYENFCETGAPPVHNCATAGEVAAALHSLASDKVGRQRSGERHRTWFMDNHGSTRWAPEYRNMLVAQARGYRFNHARSPLHAPLRADERTYHAEQLALAPVFPNYL